MADARKTSADKKRENCILELRNNLALNGWELIRGEGFDTFEFEKYYRWFPGNEITGLINRDEVEVYKRRIQ
jgi:hypothetical protein